MNLTSKFNGGLHKQIDLERLIIDRQKASIIEPQIKRGDRLNGQIIG